MIGVVDIECQALNPNMPLHPLRAFVNSPSSIRVRNVPRKIGKWNINKVTIVAIYPDNTSKTANCVLTGGVWVGTIEGSTTAGTLTQGYTILADGVDENGNDVTGYVLGKGDVEIMQSSSTPEPEPSTTFVKLQDDGTGAEDGDIYPTENGYMIQQNGEAHQLGTPFDQITAYVDTQVSSKAEISDVEDLSNSLSNYYTKSETSSNVELDAKFETKADLSSLDEKQDKLSEDQNYVLDREVYDLYTNIQTAGGAGNYTFKCPTNTFDKSLLIEQGILSDDGTTWIYQPVFVRMGSNVTFVNSGAFQNATNLLSFVGKNVQIFQSNIFNGCSALTSIEIPKVTVIGSQMFRYCTALKTLILPQSVGSISRLAFIDSSFDQVIFEGKTLAEVKAMTNYSRWGLAEDKIFTYAFQNQVDSEISAVYQAIPTNVSQLSNDAGYLTEHQSLSNYYTKSETSSNVELDAKFETKADLSTIPTKTSELSNDSGFITSSNISGIEDSISGKADLSTLSNYIHENANVATIQNLTCDTLVANDAYINGYAKTSDLSAFVKITNPWTCGWRLTFNGTPTDDSLSARLNGRLVAYTDNRKVCRFDCVLDRSNISELYHFSGMDFQAFITIKDLSNLVDGYTKAITGQALNYTDAWGYYKNEVPAKTEFDFLSVTFNVQE